MRIQAIVLLGIFLAFLCISVITQRAALAHQEKRGNNHFVQLKFKPANH